MKKILTIVGARPQFIKAAALSAQLEKIEVIEEVVIHTGQHFDRSMSDVFFQEMSIPVPRYNLNISSLNHGSMTGRMMEELEKIFIDERPDAVMVYGDTNSTLAGALGASKLHIPVIHVEAGLRSHNMKMPEEINRILTDRVSSLLLCPSILASDNLLLEGYENFDSQIEVVGDVMEDVAKYYSSTVEWDEEIAHDFGIEENKYVLFTCHRAENTDDSSRMDEIIRGLNTVSKFLPVVWPLHPRLKSKIIDYNLSENIHIIEPLGYSEMVRMIKYCSVVATDSGGLQKEAYYFGKYCITLRDETEWNELVDNNFNFLVGANAIEFERRIKEVIMKTFNSSIELYGGGKAAVNSSQVIQDFLSSLKND